MSKFFRAQDSSSESEDDASSESENEQTQRQGKFAYLSSDSGKLQQST